MDNQLQLQVNFDPLKSKAQTEAYQSWKANKGKGIIVSATGSGKTEIGLMAIRENTLKGRKAIVLVHRDSLKEQWQKQIIGLNCIVLNKQAVINQISLETDLLIDDEIHRSTGDEFIKTHDIISHRWFMGLTATPRTFENNWSDIVAKYPIIYERGIVSSIQNKFISDFQITNIGIDLSGSDLALLMKMNLDYSNISELFNNNFGIIAMCLKMQNISLRIKLGNVVGLSEKAILGKAGMAMRLVGQRASFLRNHSAKIPIIQKLIHDNKDKVIIVFAENISASEDIYKSIDESTACIVHSKRPKKERGLDEFKSNLNKTVLISAKALGDGLDIPRIDMGIDHSFNSSHIEFNQKLGRTTRNTLDRDKVAQYYVIYCKGTSLYKSQEQSWLEEAQSKIPKEKILWI